MWLAGQYPLGMMMMLMMVAINRPGHSHSVEQRRSNKTRFMKPTLIQSFPIYCQLLLSHGDHGMIMVMMIMW